ncbi:hypothetical protein CLBKND_01066 [Methylorubrum aminovorans]
MRAGQDPVAAHGGSLAMAERIPSQRRRRYAPRPRAAAPGPRRGVQELDDRAVVDDLPRPVPVGRAELEVLEMYLGPALDDVLRALKP